MLRRHWKLKIITALLAILTIAVWALQFFSLTLLKQNRSKKISTQDKVVSGIKALVGKYVLLILVVICCSVEFWGTASLDAVSTDIFIYR